MKTSLLAHATAPEFSNWLDNERATVLVPVGALEQHGPHLPLGTDSLLATAVSLGAAERTGAKVAQTLNYGYKSQQKSGGGNHLRGTLSLDADSLIGITRDITRSFLQQGVRNLVFVNGHYENYQFLYEGVDLALRDLGLSDPAGPSVLLLSYWDYVSESTLATVYPQGFPGWDIEHGGVLETSLMLHLHPELVHMDEAVEHDPALLPRFDRLPVVPERTPDTGALSAPSGSTAQKGRLLFEQTVADLATDLSTELGLER
ncbi:MULTISPECIES: creatininase [Kocuria]|uniref:creatininase n=1 Tax=Kocuria TaxID=57493 RepID=UPI00289E0D67|nr:MULTISPECIES: creatininase [Kocuria]